MDWESILFASLSSGLGIGDLITAIRSERFQLGRDTGLEGYPWYMVLKDEINLLTTIPAVEVGPVASLCRPNCAFKPLSVRIRPGFSSPMLSAVDVGFRRR